MLIEDLTKADKQYLKWLRSPRGERPHPFKFNPDRPEDTIDQLTPGENFVVLRFRAGMTQQQLAADLGVSQSQLSKWERTGSRLGLARLEAYFAGR